ncbi:MAG: ABC transporter ATP-binding protein, partial [Lachnospiraceae bacterium]|nr:ABC transporter ATP-binding protein [Lachnospiraceae bacterium]
PAIELSGGMRRRIAVARAVLSDADRLLLDEPFAGLDEENHERLIRWLLQNRNGRLLVVTTHDEADIGRMGAVVLKVDN